MKKLFVSLCCIILVALGFANVQAGTFDEVSQAKYGAIMIYADWADNLQPVMTNFGTMEQAYAGKYSFAKINIASEDAKEFNKKNYIYPNLPYILLFKERGRMSRCITRECASNPTCLKEKMELFAN